MLARKKDDSCIAKKWIVGNAADPDHACRITVGEVR